MRFVLSTSSLFVITLGLIIINPVLNIPLDDSSSTGDTVIVEKDGLISVDREEPIILPPLPGREDDEEVAFLIIPGGEINGAEYQPLGEALQNASSLKLWVGLVRPFVFDEEFSHQCSIDIEKTLAMMADQGMNSSVVITAGHSQGGTAMQNWTFSNLDRAHASVLLASKLINNMQLADAPLPIMHISGDLDGLITVVETEPVFSQLEEIAQDDPSWILKKPVVLVEDIDHMSFAPLADPAQFVKTNDIASPLGAEASVVRVADHVSAFVTVVLEAPNSEVPDAAAQLQTDHHFTAEVLRPIREMWDLTSINCSSPWASTAQQVMSNLAPSDYSSISVDDTLSASSSEFESSVPSIELNVDVAEIRTFSQVTDYPDDSREPLHSPEEIALKLESQVAVEEALELLNVTFLNGSSTCREINQAAAEEALKAASDIVRSRFLTRGRPFLFMDDIESDNETDWFSSEVLYNDTDTDYRVRASSLVLPEGGLHYCKLMPPNRAMEYIMIDSLRGTQPV